MSSATSTAKQNSNDWIEFTAVVVLTVNVLNTRITVIFFLLLFPNQSNFFW